MFLLQLQQMKGRKQSKLIVSFHLLPFSYLKERKESVNSSVFFLEVDCCIAKEVFYAFKGCLLCVSCCCCQNKKHGSFSCLGRRKMFPAVVLEISRNKPNYSKDRQKIFPAVVLEMSRNYSKDRRKIFPAVVLEI